MLKKILSASLVVLHLLTQSAGAAEFRPIIQPIAVQSIQVQPLQVASDNLKNENPLSGVSTFSFFKLSESFVNSMSLTGHGRISRNGFTDEMLSSPSGWKLTNAYLRTPFQVQSRDEAPRRPLGSSGLLTIPWVSMTNPRIKGIREFVMLTGQRKVNKGDVPYPVSYVYDTYGRMTRMDTWRSGTGFNGAVFPPGVTGLEDSTSWTYQEATGLLLSKTDDNARSVNYTYTTGGKLLTRAWARVPL